jgi:hypothetical protein
MDGQKNWYDIINSMPVLSITRSEPNEDVAVLHVRKSGKGKEVESQTNDQQIMGSQEENS